MFGWGGGSLIPGSRLIPPLPHTSPPQWLHTQSPAPPCTFPPTWLFAHPPSCLKQEGVLINILTSIVPITFSHQLLWSLAFITYVYHCWPSFSGITIWNSHVSLNFAAVEAEFFTTEQVCKIFSTGQIRNKMVDWTAVRWYNKNGKAAVTFEFIGQFFNLQDLNFLNLSNILYFMPVCALFYFLGLASL